MLRTEWLPPPIVFERRSRTESCFWNELMESAGRLSLRFCRYGGGGTAAPNSTRMMSTKRVTLRACLYDSRNVTRHTTRLVDGGFTPQANREDCGHAPDCGCTTVVTVLLRRRLHLQTARRPCCSEPERVVVQIQRAAVDAGPAPGL